MSRNYFRLNKLLKFFIERQFLKGAHYQLLFVAALIGIISLIGGVLVIPSGEPTESLGEAVWWAFLRLSDPGYIGDDIGVWRRIISTIITILGYVLFMGSLVAIITTWLNSKIRNLEQGLTKVTANNHVLILGWTNRTIHIAGEIFQSVGRLRRFLDFYGARKLKIIILAEDVIRSHVQELRDNPMIGKRANEIIFRSGTPIDHEHLRRVDSLNASAIIIPSPSYGDQKFITPDVENIKTLLSINSEVLNSQKKQRFPFVVVEIQDENKVKAAYRAYSGPIEVVASNTIISRLMAQNLRHHGLSRVYNDLLSNGPGNNIFSKEFPEIIGKTIQEIKPSFSKSIIIGVVKEEKNEFTPLLNVSHDYKIKKKDRLILLAKNSNDLEYQKTSLNENQPKVKVKRLLKTQDQEATAKILILGWNPHIPALIKELCTYEDEYYHITLVSLYSRDERQKELEKLENLTDRVNWVNIEADYVKEAELKKVKPSEFDNIVLVSSDHILEQEEADARTIVGYILLEEILEGAAKKPQVLMELSDPDNNNLLKRYKSEVIISPLILSNLLAGIALQREANSIYKELFTVGGAEIIFRSPQEYEIDTESITFLELENTAAKFGETALGVYYIPKVTKSDDDLLLNPGSNKKIKVSPNLQIVVITTVY